MEVQLAPALVAGITAGAVMAALRMAMKAGGIELRMDVARMWGTMVGLQGTRAEIVGIALHLAVSAVVGLLYAIGFAVLDVRSVAWLWGVLGGVVHYAVAGVVLAILPPIHPGVPERQPAPGPFARNLGSPDVPAFLVGHLLYGLVFGVAYAFLHPDAGTEAVL